MRDGMKISSLSRILRTACRADPIDGLAAWIGGFDDALSLVTPAQPRNFGAFQLIVRNVGYVHIQQQRRRDGTVTKPTEQFASYAGGCRIVAR